jgi:CubicO group peptidase (beta-lactamase class C family)
MVVAPDRVLYHEAFGKLSVAKGLDMPKDAIFNIASMTKPVTSVAIMMLVEEGKLKLDDEASRYIPGLKDLRVMSNVNFAAGTFDTVPQTSAITIRQLLTHTSGIAYTFSSPELALAQKVTGKTSELELPLVSQPGTQWNYGASTKVLGDIVEKVAGQRIDAFMAARILKPLGMTDTFYEVPKDKYARVVTSHQRQTSGSFTEQQRGETIPASVRGDGGLYATAGDYARFVQMLLNGGQLGGARLLQAGTVRDIERSHTGNVRVRLQKSTNQNLSKDFPVGAGADAWGLGFQLAAPSTTSASFRRPGAYTWAGIFNTQFWVDPAAKVGVIFMTQTLPFYDDRVMKLMHEFEDLVY